jgi:hypothetical protein
MPGSVAYGAPATYLRQCSNPVSRMARKANEYWGGGGRKLVRIVLGALPTYLSAHCHQATEEVL